MTVDFGEAELEAYLDESLDAGRASEIENALRTDKKLIARLARINSRRDAGIHTLGEIWRQNQIGVPTREEVMAYLAGELPEAYADYIHFRLEVLRCRYTNALVGDIERQQETGEHQARQSRRQRYLESSAGLVRRKRDE
jgi:hypothetical protein